MKLRPRTDPIAIERMAERVSHAFDEAVERALALLEGTEGLAVGRPQEGANYVELRVMPADASAAQQGQLVCAVELRHHGGSVQVVTHWAEGWPRKVAEA